MLRLGSVAKAVLRGCAMMSVLLLSAVRFHAQQDQPPVYTLKVYANLVQVPTLVLGGDQQPLPAIDFRRFLVSLDNGKKFAPANVRREGDDPLSLAIVLDASGPQSHLMTGFKDAAAKMAAQSLHPHDQLTVYALDCSLVRSVTISPEPERVREIVSDVLIAPGLNMPNGGRCTRKVYLWGAMAAVFKNLKASSGRRVVLVVSSGEDSGSVANSNQLHQLASTEGIAIFGMSDGYNSLNPFRQGATVQLRDLCETTGGILMDGNRHDLAQNLEQWIALLRNRYVVAFPRPKQLDTGSHFISVSVKGDSRAFVSLSGVSLSLPDPKLTSDPHYLPSQAGADIPVGSKRPNEH